MKEKKDVLLQHALAACKESMVFFETLCVPGIPFELEDDSDVLPMHTQTGSGFFVEPDKIVTTIDTLARAVAVVAISADQFTANSQPFRQRLRKFIGTRKISSFNSPNFDQIDEGAAAYTIEGISTFNTKNNLVFLKVTETGVPLLLGNSDTVQIGKPVYTLGYKNNVEYTGTAGTLQSRYKNDNWLQIKTQFFPGGGGGPVLNGNTHEVIGVNAFGIESEVKDGKTSVATAISSNVLRDLIAQSKSGRVMSLDQWRAHSRVHAYALETEADNKAAEYENREGIKFYNAALKRNPDLVEIYFKRGLLKTRIGNLKSALKDFNKIIRINAEHVFAYNNRASVKGNLGDAQGSLKDLNKALQIAPEYEMGYTNRGQVKSHIADIKREEGDIAEAQRYFQEAIDDYTESLALNPRNSLARKQRKYAKHILWLLKWKDGN